MVHNIFILLFELIKGIKLYCELHGMVVHKIFIFLFKLIKGIKLYCELHGMVVHKIFILLFDLIKGNIVLFANENVVVVLIARGKPMFAL